MDYSEEKPLILFQNSTIKDVTTHWLTITLHVLLSLTKEYGRV